MKTTTTESKKSATNCDCGNPCVFTMSVGSCTCPCHDVVAVSSKSAPKSSKSVESKKVVAVETENTPDSIFRDITSDMQRANDTQGQTAFVAFGPFPGAKGAASTKPIIFTFRKQSAQNAGVPESAPRGYLLGLMRIFAEGSSQHGHAYVAHLSAKMPQYKMVLASQPVVIRVTKDATPRTFDAYLVTDPAAQRLVGVLVDTKTKSIYRVVRASHEDK